MSFFRQIRVSFEGLNLAKTISALNSRNITLRKIKKQGQKISFYADASRKEEILAILNLSVYNNIKVDNYDFVSILKSKFATFVGIAVFLLVTIIPNFFIVGVSLDCASTELSNKVKDLLPTYGVSFLSPVSKCDVAALKKNILELEKVSFSEVVIKNGKAYITIESELKPNKQTAKFEIKAVREGVVTQILTLSGTPEIKVGDKVRVGQRLIGGYVTSEKTGKTAEVKASGEVYAKVELLDEKKIYKSVATFTQTGEVDFVRKMNVFGIDVFSKPCEFSYSNVEKSERVFGNVFPIKITEEKHFETKFEIVETDMENEIYVQSLAMKDDVKKYESMGKICSTYLTITDFSEYVSLNLHTIIEMKISEE